MVHVPIDDENAVQAVLGKPRINRDESPGMLGVSAGNVLAERGIGVVQRHRWRRFARWTRYLRQGRKGAERVRSMENLAPGCARQLDSLITSNRDYRGALLAETRSVNASSREGNLKANCSSISRLGSTYLP